MGVLVWRFRQLPARVEVKGYGQLSFDVDDGVVTVQGNPDGEVHMAHGQHGKVTWVALSEGWQLKVLFHLSMDQRDLLCTLYHLDPEMAVIYPKRPHA